GRLPVVAKGQLFRAALPVDDETPVDDDANARLPDHALDIRRPTFAKQRSVERRFVADIPAVDVFEGTRRRVTAAVIQQYKKAVVARSLAENQPVRLIERFGNDRQPVF